MPKAKSKPLPQFSQADRNRFFEKVDSRGPDECWPWKSYIMPKGYGQFTVARSNYLSNRLALFLHTGIDPADLEVCHTCDDRYPIGDITYRRCCNPAHLVTGTHTDNMVHMGTTGRSRSGDYHHTRMNPDTLARGERHGSHTHPESRQRGSGHCNAILTEEIVLDIRRLYAAGGVTCAGLGERFGVSPSAISAICVRRIWTHI